MLNKLIVITAIVFLGISCAIGNSDGKMGSGGDYLNPNSISSGNYPNFPWYSSDVSFTSQMFNESTFSFL